MPEARTQGRSAPSEVTPLPPELAEGLAELLAQALVAELMHSTKPVKTQAEPDATVESPPGHDRWFPGFERRTQSRE